MDRSTHFPSYELAVAHIHSLGYRNTHNGTWKNETAFVPMGQLWFAEIKSDSAGFYAEFTKEDVR